MAVTYQLWDNASNNLIEDYYSERDALEYVGEEVRAYGHGAIAEWVLLRDDGTGTITLIADGDTLASRVMQTHETSDDTQHAHVSGT